MGSTAPHLGKHEFVTNCTKMKRTSICEEENLEITVENLNSGKPPGEYSVSSASMEVGD